MTKTYIVYHIKEYTSDFTGRRAAIKFAKEVPSIIKITDETGKIVYEKDKGKKK